MSTISREGHRHDARCKRLGGTRKPFALHSACTARRCAPGQAIDRSLLFEVHIETHFHFERDRRDDDGLISLGLRYDVCKNEERPRRTCDLHTAG